MNLINPYGAGQDPAAPVGSSHLAVASLVSLAGVVSGGGAAQAALFDTDSLSFVSATLPPVGASSPVFTLAETLPQVTGSDVVLSFDAPRVTPFVSPLDVPPPPVVTAPPADGPAAPVQSPAPPPVVIAAPSDPPGPGGEPSGGPLAPVTVAPVDLTGTSFATGSGGWPWDDNTFGSPKPEVEDYPADDGSRPEVSGDWFGSNEAGWGGSTPGDDQDDDEEDVDDLDDVDEFRVVPPASDGQTLAGPSFEITEDLRVALTVPSDDADAPSDDLRLLDLADGPDPFTERVEAFQELGRAVEGVNASSAAAFDALLANTTQVAEGTVELLEDLVSNPPPGLPLLIGDDTVHSTP